MSTLYLQSMKNVVREKLTLFHRHSCPVDPYLNFHGNRKIEILNKFFGLKMGSPLAMEKYRTHQIFPKKL